MTPIEDEEAHWSKFFTGDKVNSDTVDLHAYRFHKSVCVECGKNPQEVAGNPHMENDKTHCYDCYLKISLAATLERNRLKMIEKPKTTAKSSGHKEREFYE